MRSILTTVMAFFFANGFSQTFTEICASQPLNGTLVSAEIYNDSVYVAGFFTQICGQPTSYLAKWDNGGWVAKDIGLTDPVHSIRNIDDTLYIARYEESIDSNWLYRYDGNTLSTFGEGIYLTTASNFSELPNLYDVVKYNGTLIACGEFDRVGTQAISGIMSWNGFQWTDIAGGLTGNIANTPPVIYPHQMMVHSGNLYVVGNFRYAGGIEVNGIAIWNGSQWLAMGSGFNSTVYGIAVYDNEIYAGGGFTQSGTNTVNRLAKWDGTDWISPGFGFIEETINDYIFVHTLTEIDGELYIAGGLKNIEYDNLSTELCGGIVTYNGTAINTFNGGVPNNDIEAVIKTPNDTLLIGGGVFGGGYAGMIGETAALFELSSDSFAKVYPNPSIGKLTIELPESTDFSVTIENILGEIVLSKRIKNSIHSMLELNFPSGVYYIKIQTDNAQDIQKIILE